MRTTTSLTLALMAMGTLTAGCSSTVSNDSSFPEPESVQDVSQLPEDAVFRYGVEDFAPERQGAARTQSGNRHVLHYAERYDLAREAYEKRVEATTKASANVADQPSNEGTKEQQRRYQQRADQSKNVSSDDSSSAKAKPLDDDETNRSAETAVLESNPSADDYEKIGVIPPK